MPATGPADVSSNRSKPRPVRDPTRRSDTAAEQWLLAELANRRVPVPAPIAGVRSAAGRGLLLTHLDAPRGT
jgi:hypothetical protein